MNSSMALNRTRSANEPMMSAGVMTAKVSWNMEKTVSGTEPCSESRPMPAKKAFPSPPMKGSSAGEGLCVNTSE